MNFNWFEIEHDAKELIDSTAEAVISDYDDDVPIEERIFDAVSSATMYYSDMLLLIAYYGIADAFTGNSNYDDSPCCQFELDVWRRVEDLMEDSETETD